MLISLSAKNKTGYVDGTLVKPLATSISYEAWECCNSMLISWMLGVLDQNIAQSVLYFTTAREIRLNLKKGSVKLQEHCCLSFNSLYLILNKEVILYLLSTPKLR